MYSKAAFISKTNKLKTKGDRDSMLRSYESIDHSEARKYIDQVSKILDEDLKGIPDIIIANTLVILSEHFHLWRLNRDMCRDKFLLHTAIASQFPTFQVPLQTFKFCKPARKIGKLPIQESEFIEKINEQFKTHNTDIDITSVYGNEMTFDSFITQCNYDDHVLIVAFEKCKTTHTVRYYAIISTQKVTFFNKSHNEISSMIEEEISIPVGAIESQASSPDYQNDNFNFEVEFNYFEPIYDSNTFDPNILFPADL